MNHYRDNNGFGAQASTNSYRFLRFIRAGAHAQVWLGEQWAEGRRLGHVAIKVVQLPAHACDAERAWAEAELLRRGAGSPYVVQVHDLVRIDAWTIAIIMEFVDGPALDQLIAAEGPLDSDRALRLISHVSNALRDFHAEDSDNISLAHLDVKPGNILIYRKGSRETAKLADGSIITSLQVHAAALGPLDYRAPDVYGRPTTACDYWSLGLVLAEMTSPLDLAELAERVAPLDRFGASATRSRRIGTAVVALATEHCEPRVAALITRMLEPEPGRRAGHADIVSAIRSSSVRTTKIPVRVEIALEPPEHPRPARPGPELRPAEPGREPSRPTIELNADGTMTSGTVADIKAYLGEEA